MRLSVSIVLALCVALSSFAQSAPADDGGLTLVAINAAGDSFTMGDGSFGPGATETITSSFRMSKFPVTNGQFGQFVSDGGYATQSYWTTNGWRWKGGKSQPAFWTDKGFNAPDQPVVGVSWYEAVAFCNWLSAKEGIAPAIDQTGRIDLSAPGYRLPTEVEWEYAAAKGAPDQARRIYPWGDDWDPARAVSRVRPAAAARTAPVGSRSPQGDTPQGLADMAGNVWEWCGDNFQGNEDIARTGTDRYYFESDSPQRGFVLRGGSWVIEFPNGMRAAFRSFSSPAGLRYNVYGFRVVRTGVD